jgi:peptide/nickel transport system permease protein
MLARFALRRILDSLPVLLGVSIITFALVQATIGSYVPGLELNRDLKPEDIVRLRHAIGLDQPWWFQYLNWLGIAWIAKAVGLGAALGGYPVNTGLLEGDLGRSIIDGTSITTNILARLGYTLELTLTAVCIGVLIAIPLGVVGALRRGSLVDQTFTVASTAGVAVPAFWTGLVTILLFAVLFHEWNLPALPTGGAESPLGGGDPFDRLAHLVLPATVLSFGYLAIWSRYVRSGMLEVLGQDFVRTARAKGMTDRRVVYVHALRNAIVPLVTLIGLELPGLFSGSAIIEIVFSWPGLGRYALSAVQSHDITVVLALTVFGSSLVVIGNLVADVLYAVLDPRIRYA